MWEGDGKRGMLRNRLFRSRWQAAMNYPVPAQPRYNVAVASRDRAGRCGTPSKRKARGWTDRISFSPSNRMRTRFQTQITQRSCTLKRHILKIYVCPDLQAYSLNFARPASRTSLDLLSRIVSLATLSDVRDTSSSRTLWQVRL